MIFEAFKMRYDKFTFYYIIDTVTESFLKVSLSNNDNSYLLHTWSYLKGNGGVIIADPIFEYNYENIDVDKFRVVHVNILKVENKTYFGIVNEEANRTLFEIKRKNKINRILSNKGTL